MHQRALLSLLVIRPSPGWQPHTAVHCMQQQRCTVGMPEPRPHGSAVQRAMSAHAQQVFQQPSVCREWPPAPSGSESRRLQPRQQAMVQWTQMRTSRRMMSWTVPPSRSGWQLPASARYPLHSRQMWKCRSSVTFHCSSGQRHKYQWPQTRPCLQRTCSSAKPDFGSGARGSALPYLQCTRVTVKQGGWEWQGLLA